MLDKKRGYAYNRPFYPVDTTVNIQSGMVAFLATNVAGVVVATTAASGTVPIGTFWKDRAASYVRNWMDSLTFNANNIITVSKGNILTTASVRVTNAAGTTTYTQGTDYTVTVANGVITRLAAGAITAAQTVLVTYRYNVQAGTEEWENASTQWSTAQNYDRQANDTLGSGSITISEGDAKLFTDQYDPAQTYTLNATLRSNAASLWTTGAGISSICGRVIRVPTANDPFLGLDQIRVGF